MQVTIERLQRAIHNSASLDEGQRTHFPLITGEKGVQPLTDEQVAAALEQIAQQEIAHAASFLRQ